ncbi:MAG: oxidoreductase [Intrasporangium sp.]|uniref:NAD(P)-dependent oxidoreductase n=1 Tax=Intrasporangium sp. TaxID=1925024 RepID=UPI0026471760|nr:NAD(P)-dependent oxidoreductase [Intrasporangium sp.]MDN5794804.1 oxidoreductase [Intrasporangium sp.]
MTVVVVALGQVEPDLVEPYLPEGARVVADPGPDELAAAVGALVRADVLVDSDLLSRMPRLRVLARTGVGTDRVDVPAATARGIPVVITPGSGTGAVAEGAMALALCLVKRLRVTTDLVREGRWPERSALALGDLSGATMGILGYGRIGCATARLADAFGMRVLAHDPFAPVTPPAVPATLEQVLTRSDVISLHLPLTPENRHLVDEARLARAKRGAILVNCGRGGLVDLDATYDALRAGRLGGVGLDVYDPEPPEHHPLFDHPDVVLTPHLMGMTRRATALTYADAARGITAVLSGQPPAAVANPDWTHHHRNPPRSTP